MSSFTKKSVIMTVLITVVLVSTSGTLLESFHQKLPSILKYIIANSDILLAIIASLAATGAFLSSMINYLNKGIGENKNHKTNDDLLDEIKILHRKITDIENKPSSGLAVEINEKEREELISEAKKRITGNTILLADASLKADISDFKKSYSLHKLHTDMVFRLESEIDRLNRRGGVNLAIGSVIALVGILSLAFFLYHSPSTSGGLNFFIHHLPKLSFVVVVELFAYFFLRLYKNGFDEIKYFQNEITNIEMKIMSLKYAQDFKSEDIIKELAMHLMKTERNFILEKGQTTVSIEKERLQKLSDSKITSVISDIIKLKQK